MSPTTFSDEANQLLLSMREKIGGVQRVTERFKVFDRPAAVKFLSDALSSPDAGVRCDALEILKAIEPDEAYRHVLHMTNDPDPMMRFAALDFLAEYQRPDSIPSVIHSLRNDADGVVRYKAASVLEDIGDTSVIPELERTASTDNAVDNEGRSIRELATRAIATIRSRTNQVRP